MTSIFDEVNGDINHKHRGTINISGFLGKQKKHTKKMKDYVEDELLIHIVNRIDTSAIERTIENDIQV